MIGTLEIRTGRPGAFELRTAADGQAVLTGYALKYNTLSQNLGGFVETIAPGTFDKSIADGIRVLARYNHDDNWLLGSTDGGTLTLESDNVGLRYDVALPDTTAGRDVRALAARGDVHHSSFAFYVMEGGDEWSLTDQGFPLRTLRAGQLVDVAPVNSPAYLDTTSGLRSLGARTGLGPTALAAATRDELAALIVGGPPSPPAEIVAPVRVRARHRLEIARHSLTTH